MMVNGMNSNPNASQKRYHNDLRVLFWEKFAARCEIHHIFGSKEKFKLLKEAGIDKPGEWFVIMLPKDVHDSIKEYSFEAERARFFQQQRDYLRHFGEPSPVPDDVIRYYTQMLSKHHRLKIWEC
jgi:hypothetical protein